MSLTAPRDLQRDASVALERGVAVCFDRDRGTASAHDGTRDNYIELPSAANHRNFAGVVAQNHAAKTYATREACAVFQPGSHCVISTLIPTTINSTILTALVSAGQANGRFIQAGYVGRGSAKAMQTIANATDADDLTPQPVSQSLDGACVYTATTRNFAATGKFAKARVGDYIYVVAGSTAAGAAAGLTYGRYTISTITDDDNAIVSVSPGSTNAIVAIYVVRGNPTVQAELLGGDESGLIEWIVPIHNTTIAVAPLRSGLSLIFGGTTFATGDGTYLIVDGVEIGERKGFLCMGAITTNEFQVLDTASNLQTLGGTTLTVLASIEFEAATESAHAVWDGVVWQVVAATGVTLV
jgi:hypothetical protein